MARVYTFIACATIALVCVSSLAEAAQMRELSVQRNVICKTYRAPAGRVNITSSAVELRMPATAMVTDKFNVLDIAVGMNITHPQIGALKLVLENREPCTLRPFIPAASQTGLQAYNTCIDAEKRSTRLMSNFGGQQSNMYNTFFDDYATKVLETDENGETSVSAPFTGIFKPQFSIKRMIRGVDGKKHRAARGGSMGTWSLYVTDRNMGANDAPRGYIDSFEVVLCTREKIGKGINMTGFIPFAEALNQPASMPEPVVEEEVEEIPLVTANSGPEAEAFTGIGGFGRFNPLLQPLQQLYATQESILFGIFNYLFYKKLILGLIPFPDPGNYALSDPIPFEETFGDR
jgi:subtilisin-like proprotein convertase family protein